MEAIISVAGLVVGLIIIGFMMMVVKCFKKVEQGRALIINRMANEPKVTFSGGFVIPVIHKGEYMDISLKTIEIDRQAEDGLICQDNIRADIKVVFFVRVNKTENDVKKVAQAIGCERASARETLEALFQAKFSEALKTVGKKMDFISLYQERTSFKESIIESIGEDLNGYRLEDVAIDYLEQTSLDRLNENNILDSQGIKKIRELTAQEKIKANEIMRNEEKIIKQQDVETREQILELERQQKEAEAKQKREIEIIIERERAEAAKVREEERYNAETAKIQTDQKLAIEEENKLRDIITAQKNKEKIEKVEEEKVIKAQEIEKIKREEETQLMEIAKEMAVEEEKKKIEEVIRERVVVQRGVVEEEEKIKDTQELAGANREKDVKIIAAEQEAQEKLVKDIKEAEAKKEAALFLAEEKIVSAKAEQEASIKVAEAKKILAEGTIAEEAAKGLAEVKVEKAQIEMIEERGKAQANANEMGYRSEAVGIEEKKKAEASGVELVSKAEALGIREKADAMKEFDGVGREHEEFKLRLQKEEKIDLAEIDANKDIAKEQADLVAEGLKSANIDIVGGDNDFFDKIVKSISYGKSFKRFVDSGDVKETLLGDGETAGLIDGIKSFINKFGLKSEDIKNISLAALSSKLLEKAKGQDKSLLESLIGMINDKGLSSLKVEKFL